MPFHFTSRLINDPFHDPGLFIPFCFEKKAIIFDLGDLSLLSDRDIYGISHVFVSHTHMDHFVGFDRLLRLSLGREKELYLFGPPGFLKNLEGKLSGYSWNLAESFQNRFSIHGREVHPDCIFRKRYHCSDKFVSTHDAEKLPFTGSLIREPAWSVSAVLLDHGLFSMGFTFNEHEHIHIDNDALVSLGLETGPWLNGFKQKLWLGEPLDTEVEVDSGKGERKKTTFTLGNLKDRITRITPGQKIAYITDVAYHEENARKIIGFAANADHLYIEAPFLEKEGDLSKRKNHLTARQAGFLAGMAKVKRLTLFHYSPKYTGQAHLLTQEAMDAYHSALNGTTPLFPLELV